MEQYILSLDQGTSSSRAIVFDRKGQIRSMAQREFPQYFPKPGWVEHNPHEIWSSQASVIAEAIAAIGINGLNIAGIGITNQRETTIVWDSESEEPVYNAIVWQDRRTSEYCDQLKAEGRTEFIRERTGLIVDAYFSATKIKWILDNVPGARARAEKGKLMFDGKTVTPFEAPEIDPHLVKRSHETFHVAHLEATDFIESRPRAVLGMVPGEIVTTDAGYAEKISVEDDILKIAVIERHKNTHHIGIGYIKGYGLKSGAVATSISHDSHNIIVVGANEEDMVAAVNRVVELGGGIVVMDDGKVLGELQLQIAGIMSEAPLIEVNEALENAKEQAFKLGVSRGVDPFMTLSFMALTVIPTLRLTTRGVFDVINQRYV